MKLPKWLLDHSLYVLLFSNIVTLVLAIVESWEVGTLLWIFWIQSIGIGMTNFLRILSLKNFSTKGFKVNGRSVEPTRSTKIQTAFFFAVHYGLFHLGYLGFLAAMVGFQNFLAIGLTGILFLVNHFYSYFYHKKKESKKKVNIGTVMFYPYLRVFPMHFMIVLGFVLEGSLSLFFFMILKTFADVGMHIVEHYI